MKLENGIEKMMARRNKINGDRKGEEREGTEQFIPVTEEQSWQESVGIIATKGFIRGIKL